MICKLQDTRIPHALKPVIPKIGKVALITGASSGLGRELAILFSKLGHVILSGRDKDRLDTTKNLCADPANTTIVCGDLRSFEIETRLAYFADLYGLQYLICCAGEYLEGPFEEASTLNMSSVINSNLTATISLIRAIYPLLAGNLNGNIVHINSVAGKNTGPNELAYMASKHGMAAFLKGLRYEAFKKNVRVLDVYPGAIKTPLTEGRDNYDSLMNVQEVASAVFANVTAEYGTLQIEELHLGRTLCSENRRC